MDIITRPKACIHELPLELHSKIIKNVFNLVLAEDEEVKASFDPTKLEQYFLNPPIPLGVKYAQEFHQLQKMCQKEIGGKKFLAQELFVLPRRYRDVFIRMAKRENCSRMRLEFEGNISRDDLTTLVKIKDKNIKKGLRLHASRGGEVYYIALGAMVMFFCSVVAGSLLKFDETSFAHVWIGRRIICSFLSSFPLALIAFFLKTTYMYDERCFYDDRGQLRDHYRSQAGGSIDYK